MNTPTVALTWPAPRSAAAASLPVPAVAGSWSLRRRSSIAPRQLMLVFGMLCAVSLTIGVGFWWLGAGPVLAFAGLELLAVAAALLVHARHVGDGEAVTLHGQGVDVETWYGGSVSRLQIGLPGLRVVPPADGRSPVWMVLASGRRIGVGLQVPYTRRLAFAKDLRRAIDDARRCGLQGVPVLESM